VYVWLDSAARTLNRVALRVRKGGHHVDADTVGRRYGRSAANFFNLSAPLAETGRTHNNSLGKPALIAQRYAGRPESIVNPFRFRHLQETGRGCSRNHVTKRPQD